MPHTGSTAGLARAAAESRIAPSPMTSSERLATNRTRATRRSARWARRGTWLAIKSLARALKSGITSTPSTERMSDDALPVAAAATIGVVPGSAPLPPDIGTTFGGARAGGTGPPPLAVTRTGTAVPFAGALPATAQG